jgi:hypothetical protein
MMRDRCPKPDIVAWNKYFYSPETSLTFVDENSSIHSTLDIILLTTWSRQHENPLYLHQESRKFCSQSSDAKEDLGIFFSIDML